MGGCEDDIGREDVSYQFIRMCGKDVTLKYIGRWWRLVGKITITFDMLLSIMTSTCLTISFANQRKTGEISNIKAVEDKELAMLMFWSVIRRIITCDSNFAFECLKEAVASLSEIWEGVKLEVKHLWTPSKPSYQSK